MVDLEYNVVFDDGGISEIVEDTPFISSRKKDLLQALKATAQEPPPRPFQNFDILWLLHVTSGLGLHNNAEIAIIPWDHLDDFIEGELNNLDFLCKFMKTKKHVKSFAPNTLRHLQANSIALVYRRDKI
jgi:hypothetical protein